MRRSILLVAIILFLFSGCIGGPQPTPAPETVPPAETTPPAMTTAPPEAPATTAPPLTTQPPTTPAPTTAPPETPPPTPESKYALQTTSATDLLPSGVSKLEPIGGDYDSVLKFPVKIGTMVEDVKASYGIQASYGVAAGAIYVLKFSSSDHAADFFNHIVEKSKSKGTPLTEKTLSSGGKSLKIYHQIEFTKYIATLFRRGIFIVRVGMTGNAVDAEGYILNNMLDLFDAEAPAQPIPLVTRSLDFLSASTSSRDVVPEGASSTAAIPSTDYQFTLRYSTKPPSYREDVKATYAVPDGSIYVSKFDSASEAEAFLNTMIETYSRVGNAPVRKVLTADGKSLTVYHRIDTAYKGTVIQKGLFLYYVAVTKDDFDAEFYITRKMGYLFQ